MKKFLVGEIGECEDFENSVVLVNAKYEMEALQIAMDYFRENDLNFSEYLYERTCNASFAEQFWFQTEEENKMFNEKGKILCDKETFSTRVFEYFKGHEDYAALYIKHYFQKEDLIFPDEMIKFIHEKEVLENAWSNLSVIDLDSLPVLNCST